MSAGTLARPPALAPGLAPGPASGHIDRSDREAAFASLPTTRIADIEVLRAIAVLMVLYEHLPHNLVYWNSRSVSVAAAWFRGWVGVDLFFAISGFVIARGLLPVLLRCADANAFVLETVRFWLRRAWRLLPTAWLWLLMPIGLCLLSNRAEVFYDARANFAALVAGVLDVANIRVGVLYGVKPIGVAFPYWSLSLEEQFYLLLPLALFLFRRWIALPLLVLVLLQFGFARPTPMQMMLRPGAICVGVLLALWEGSATWRLLEPRILAASRPARIAVLLLLLALLMALGNDDMGIVPLRIGMVSLLSGVLVWIASYGRGHVCREGRPRRLLCWLAARSYAIYVIHVPVYLGFHELWFRLHPRSDPHGAVALAYVAAALLLILLLAWGNDRWYADRLRSYGAGVAARFGRGG